MGIDKYLKSKSRPLQMLPGTNKGVLATNTVRGPTQIRCPRCKSMMGPDRLPNGDQCYSCSSCGNILQQKVI
jgi:hypothetical protein